MAKNLYLGVSSIAKKINKIYMGNTDIAHKVKKIYIGDSNGVAREAYSGRTYETVILQPRSYGVYQSNEENPTSFSLTSNTLLDGTLYFDPYNEQHVFLSRTTSNEVYVKKVGASTWTKLPNNFRFSSVYTNYYLFSFTKNGRLWLFDSSNGNGYVASGFDTGSFTYQSTAFRGAQAYEERNDYIYNTINNYKYGYCSIDLPSGSAISMGSMPSTQYTAGNGSMCSMGNIHYYNGYYYMAAFSSTRCLIYRATSLSGLTNPEVVFSQSKNGETIFRGWFDNKMLINNAGGNTSLCPTTGSYYITLSNSCAITKINSTYLQRIGTWQEDITNGKLYRIGYYPSATTPVFQYTSNGTSWTDVPINDTNTYFLSFSRSVYY